MFLPACCLLFNDFSSNGLCPSFWSVLDESLQDNIDTWGVGAPPGSLSLMLDVSSEYGTTDNVYTCTNKWDKN